MNSFLATSLPLISFLFMFQLFRWKWKKSVKKCTLSGTVEVKALLCLRQKRLRNVLRRTGNISQKQKTPWQLQSPIRKIMSCFVLTYLKIINIQWILHGILCEVKDWSSNNEYSLMQNICNTNKLISSLRCYSSQKWFKLT